MKFGFKKKGILITWTASYMLVLLLPFLINVIFYTQSETVLTTEVREHNMSNLKSKGIQIDNAVDELMQATFNLYYGTTADEIANFPEGAFNADSRYNALIMSELLRDYELDIPYIKKIYFYFNSIDKVVCSNGTYGADEFHITGLTQEYQEQWKDILRNRATSSFVSIGDNPKKVYFVYSDSNHVKYRKNLLIEVDFNEVLSPLISSDDAFVEGIAVISPEGEILSANGNAELNEILQKADIQSDENEYHIDIDKKDYMILTEKSEKNDLIYAYATVENSFYETVERSKMLNIISLIACVLLGFGIIYVSLRRNYDPIKGILKILNEENEEKYSGENEFDYVNKVISDIIVKKKEFTSRLQTQEPLLRNNILRQILNGNTNNLPIADVLESLNINFVHNYFMVMIFYIENSGELFFGNRNDVSNLERNKELANYAMENVMEELLSSEECNIVSLEENSMLTLILNVKENSGEVLNHIREKLAEGKAFLEEKCNLYFTVGISDIHSETDGIALGYGEAIRCIEQRFLLKKEETILFKDLKKSDTQGYYFPLDVEQKLIYCLKVGQYRDCSNILDDIFEKNMDEQRIGVDLAKCLMFDIMGAVVKALTEIYSTSSEKITDMSNMFEEALSCRTANEMLEKIKTMLATVCEDVEKMPLDTSSNLMEKIDDYLKESYCDTELNVTSIAEYLGMNTTYLSNMFKKKKGIGLLEYITNLRVEKAKEILREEPSVTLEVLCKRVGIGNVRTFSRVFAKHTGVSPGKFKEIVLKEKSRDTQE